MATADLTVTFPALTCLPCLGERKTAELAGRPVDDMAPPRPAVTLLGGTAICYEHLTVQPASPLTIPGQAAPRLH